jgi:hypothetical protein
MLVLAAVVSGIAAFGQMLGSAGQATRTGSWLPDIGAATLGDAVGTNVTLTYGGYYDSKQMYAQLAAAVLALLGAGAVLAARRGWGAAAMWLFWLAVSIDFKVNPANGIASTFIGSFFYKSYVRVQAHISLFVPALGAIGVLFTAAGLAHVLANHRQLAKLPFLRSPGPVAVVLAVLAVLAYVPTASVAYEHRNAEVIASRYLTPEFTRVDAHDRQAADWLRERIRPGERVMNSANDGSTAAYVEDGVPVVNVVTLGAIQAPYTFALLKSFRDYPDDPVIRKELLDLNVSYVYVDTAAPMMGAGPGAPDNWLGEPAFTQAPGLKNLDGLPGLSAGFRAGTVTVYTLDRRVLAGLRG